MNVSLGVCMHAWHIKHLEIRGPLVGIGSPSTTIWVLKFEAWGLPVLGGGGRTSLALVQVSKHRMLVTSIEGGSASGRGWPENCWIFLGFCFQFKGTKQHHTVFRYALLVKILMHRMSHGMHTELTVVQHLAWNLWGSGLNYWYHRE